jgi:hypothetical protein
MFGSIRRLTFAAIVATLVQPAVARAQTDQPAQARRQWIMVSYSWMYNWPLHFDNYPLEDLVGQKVEEAEPPYDYRSDDSRTLIDVVEFKRRGIGVGATVFPFGMRGGPTLGVRGSIENLPDIRLQFDGPGRPFDTYTFTNGLAYDVSAGIWVADRAPGWGLGSYAFVAGGIGRLTSDLGDGRRIFAEGGGGVQTGPIGFEVSLKFGWNRLTEPVEHRFLSVPLTMRATVGF